MKQSLKNIRAVYKVKRRRHQLKNSNNLAIKQVIYTHELFCDAVFFAGISIEGFTMISRMAFRPEMNNENWLTVNIPGSGIWSFENLSLKEGSGYRQAKLIYNYNKSGDYWKIKFEGKLFQKNREQNIKLDIKWIPATSSIHYNEPFASDLKIVKQLMLKNENPDLFEKNAFPNQIVIEQAGKMSGTINFDGEMRKLDLIGIKKHTRGINNWNDRDRHYWITGLLENGNYLSIHYIDYTFLNNQVAGYIYTDQGIRKITKVLGVEKPNFDQVNNEPILFDFETEESDEILHIKIIPQINFTYQVHKNYLIILAEVTITINGFKGIGLFEKGVTTTNT